jgi:gliding motility-associated-like protein
MEIPSFNNSMEFFEVGSVLENKKPYRFATRQVFMHPAHAEPPGTFPKSCDSAYLCGCLKNPPMLFSLPRLSLNVVLLLLVWFHTSAQKPDWVRTSKFPNPAQGNLFAKRIVTAPDGGVYMLLQYYGTVIFGGTTITAPTNTFDDGLLVKFNANGDLLWYKKLFESEHYYSNRVIDLKVDHENNLVFSGSSLWPTKVLGSSISGVGQFIAKIDGSGNLRWVDFPPLAGGSIAEHDVSRRGNRIGFTPDGDILWFTDRINEFAPSGGLAVLKYKPDGTKVTTMYVTRNPSFYRPNMQDFSVDAGGNFVISGNFESTVAFPGGPSLSNNGSHSNPIQFFIAKFKPDGQLLWVVYSNYAANLVTSHTVDHEGNVYAALQLDGGGTIYAPAGGGVISVTQRCLAKITKDGELQWMRPMSLSNVEDIFLAPDGLLYVTGGAFTSEFHYQTYTRHISGSSAYVMKVDTDGNFHGAYFGEPQDDPSTLYGSDAYGYQSVVDADGNIYTAGGFWDGVVWGCIASTTDEYGLFLVKHMAAESPVRAVSGPGTVCEGTDITLSTDLISNGVLYRWFTPAGADPEPGTTLKNSVAITARASYDGEAVIVTITDNCDVYFATPYVLDIPPPPTQPELIVKKDVVCPGKTADYEIIATEGNIYTWTLPDGATSPNLTAKGGTFSFGSNFAGGDVRITSSNLCGSAEKLFHISTYASPGVPNLTGDLVLCPGIVQIQRSISAVPNATSYQWELPPFISFNPLFPTNNLTLNAVVVDGLVSGQIRVRAVGICNIGEASAPISISRASNPGSAASIMGVHELCTSNQSVRYSVAPVSNATKYTWTIPATFNKTGILVTDEPFVDLTALHAGEGEISVTGKNDCQQKGSPSSFTVTTYEPLPTPVITIRDCDSQITVSNAENVSWYFNGMPASHLSGTQITLADSGRYYVEVKNFCGIKQSEVIQAFPVSSVETLVPNVITPNGDGKNDFLLIDKSLPNATVHILNRWGELIYFSSNYKNQWAAEDLAPGTYYLTVTHPCLPQGYRGWLSVVR